MRKSATKFFFSLVPMILNLATNKRYRLKNVFLRPCPKLMTGTVLVPIIPISTEVYVLSRYSETLCLTVLNVSNSICTVHMSGYVPWVFRIQFQGFACVNKVQPFLSSSGLVYTKYKPLVPRVSQCWTFVI